MSSAGYQYLDDSGIIVPDTADLQTQVEGEYKTALNDDAMPTDPETPQGALIVAETVARANVLANNSAVANQINPNMAGGIFLESLCRLTGLEPPSATYTLVTAVAVTGRVNTVIPEGSLVAASLDPTAPQFAVVAATTILGPGTTVTLQAVDSGPVPAPLGVSWYIISAVLGWETVSTVGAASVIGTDKLSDAELRTLRAQTLALQGTSLSEAITSALNDTPGVQSIAFRENVADTTQTIDGISMVAHSIWACVNGGTNTDVATALLGCKTLGANWNGATTVNIVDPSSGQTYPVKFDRPTTQNIWVRVTYIGATVTGDGPTLISNAILAYQAGSVVGMPGFTVGTDVSPFELAAAVANQVPGIFVTKVEVSTDGTTYQTTQIVIPLNQIAVTIAGRISSVAV
jgi:hypothetical protein